MLSWLPWIGAAGPLGVAEIFTLGPFLPVRTCGPGGRCSFRAWRRALRIPRRVRRQCAADVRGAGARFGSPRAAGALVNVVNIRGAVALVGE
jgi:hypothetical protein